MSQYLQSTKNYAWFIVNISYIVATATAAATTITATIIIIIEFYKNLLRHEKPL